MRNSIHQSPMLKTAEPGTNPQNRRQNPHYRQHYHPHCEVQNQCITRAELGGKITPHTPYLVSPSYKLGITTRRTSYLGLRENKNARGISTTRDVPDLANASLGSLQPLQGQSAQNSAAAQISCIEGFSQSATRSPNAGQLSDCGLRPILGIARAPSPSPRTFSKQAAFPGGAVLLGQRRKHREANAACRGRRQIRMASGHTAGARIHLHHVSHQPLKGHQNHVSN